MDIANALRLFRYRFSIKIKLIFVSVQNPYRNTVKKKNNNNNNNVKKKKIATVR